MTQQYLFFKKAILRLYFELRITSQLTVTKGQWHFNDSVHVWQLSSIAANTPSWYIYFNNVKLNATLFIGDINSAEVFPNY